LLLSKQKDRCYDHELVIASPIDYDHGRIPIGWRDHWRHSATLDYNHGDRRLWSLLTVAEQSAAITVVGRRDYSLV